MSLFAHVRTRGVSSAWVGLALACTVLTAACGRSDASVQSDLQQQLTADPATSSAHLTITVKDGTADMTGTTDSVQQQQRIVDVARAVKGVKQVQTDMRLSDHAMVGEVKKAIDADPSVSQIPLRIEVTNAEVTLSSDQTNEDQRTRLKELAGGVPGIVHVEDHMK